MSLLEQIDRDIKVALLGREATRLRGLRAIKAAILLARSEKGSPEDLTPPQEIKLLQKLIKQRKESMEIYTAQHRDDLLNTEMEEVVVIETYLPTPLSPTEVDGIIAGLIAQHGFTGLTDLGKLIALATKMIEGKADGKTIAEISKRLLAI